MACDNDALIIFRVMKAIYNIYKFVIPVYLIFMLTIDFSNIIISRNNDDISKTKRMIFYRVFYCIVFYLVPMFVFSFLKICVGNSIIDIDLLRNCWNIA